MQLTASERDSLDGNPANLTRTGSGTFAGIAWNTRRAADLCALERPLHVWSDGDVVGNAPMEILFNLCRIT